MTRTSRRPQFLRSFLIVFVFLAFLLAISPTPVAHAGNITVNSADGGTGGPACKLRDAIKAANTNAATGGCPAGSGADTITLLPAGMTITLTAADNHDAGVEWNGLPAIDSDITINGNGATIQRSSAGGTDNFRFFKIMPERTVALNDLTLSNGSLPDSSLATGGSGGAISNHGFLTMNHVTVSGNHTGNGLSAGSGGGIMNAGTLTVTNSTLIDNHTGVNNSANGGAGGAIYNGYHLVVENSTIVNNTTGFGFGPSGGSGGGIVNGSNASMTLTNTVITSNVTGNGSNSGGYGGGIYDGDNVTASIINSRIDGNLTGNGTNVDGGHGGGIFHSGGALTISGSSITNNVTGNTSVGQGGRGAGIYNGGGALSITNSTIAGNTAGTPDSDSGGILSEGTFATLNVTSSTIANNTANNTAVWAGGGIKVNSGTGVVKNTIVANNSPAATNCIGTITNGGNNLDSGTSCGWGSNNGSMSDTFPFLGALASNGGSTQTLALQTGSPAIDGVTYNSSNGSPSTDQRGLARPKGARHDIGAYEANFITVTDTSGGTGLPGCKLRDAITAANGDAATGGCSAGFGPDIIVLPASATITLNVVDNGSMISTNGLPVVTTNIVISGNNSIIERSSGGGTPAFRIFSIETTGILALNNVTLRNGRTPDGPPGAPGGSGGGIFSAGILNVTNSTISGNHTGNGTAGGSGGGIYSHGSGGLTIYKSTISGNTTGNATLGNGGNGAGISSEDEAFLTIINATVTSNATGSPNGMGGGVATANAATVINSTIVSNTATASGGGIRTAASTTVRNSIVAYNTAPMNGNCDGSISNGGNNLEDANDCSWGIVDGSMNYTHPLLGPLANHGGPTQTMALLPGSPAIDGVTYNGSNLGPPTDQRGYARPYGPHYDIGAFEWYNWIYYLPHIKRVSP